MTIRAPFKPHYGTTQTVNGAVGSNVITIGAGDKTLAIKNSGTGVGYFRTYKASDVAQPATAADTPVFNGDPVRYFEKPQDHDTLAYIGANSTLVVQSGEAGH